MITRRELLAGTGLAAAGIVLGAAPQDKRLKVTESNIEGPFYRKNAPFRAKLAEGVKGKPLAVSGRVLASDGKPLAGALVDVWQADTVGDYDNTSRTFTLRGRLRADKEGLYRYETIIPGQYDLGQSKRPAHIHYKVSAPDHRLLTTQLYFKGDPYLAKDPFARESLVIELKNDAGTFDIVLAKR